MASQRGSKPSADRWLNLKEFQAEVKERLNVFYEVETFYKFRKQKIPSRKASGELQFPAEAAIDWIVKTKFKQ